MSLLTSAATNRVKARTVGKEEEAVGEKGYWVPKGSGEELPNGKGLTGVGDDCSTAIYWAGGELSFHALAGEGKRREGLAEGGHQLRENLGRNVIWRPLSHRKNEGGVTDLYCLGWGRVLINRREG